MTGTQAPPSHRVAVNMRRLRQERGWTQDQLGERLDWTNVAVSAAECSNGSGRPRKFGIDEVVQIAEVLGVTVADLIEPPPCTRCGDSPPAGFTCNTCGRSG